MKKVLPKMSVKLNNSEEIINQALIEAGAGQIAKNFAKTGLPTRKNELYHYSDLKLLLDNIPQITRERQQGERKRAKYFSDINAYQIDIINGEVVISDIAPEGIVVFTSKGGLEEAQNDIIAQLNSALTSETLNIDIEKNKQNIIIINRQSLGEAEHINDGVEISVAQDVKATIIELFSSSDNAHLSNHASKIILQNGASADHIVVDLAAEKNRHLNTIQYELSENSSLNSMILHKGSLFARTQIFAKFEGEGAHADFGGINLAAKNQHQDITLNVEHNVANTTSSENYRSIAIEEAKAIFQGKIIVARDAQKTDANMNHRALILSDDAQILVKPELEIYADDVVCGHGATCGALDEEGLFYLMSRGIDKRAAKSMLIRAFLTQIFEQIEDEKLLCALDNVIEEWLEEL